MQLDKLVAYHKALGDPTRLRILHLLVHEECSGQQLAERLLLSQPTITHHAAKLRDAALIRERRDKNTVYFSLNRYFLESGAEATLKFLTEEYEMNKPLDESEEQLKNSVLHNFFNKDGRLKQIPAQLKKKLIVLESLVERLEPGRKYEEREMNEFIKQFHEDYATLRREFVMQQFMYRENEIYELNPKNMWPAWNQLK